MNTVDQHGNVNGNNNITIIVAGDMNGVPPQIFSPPDPPKPVRTRTSHRRLGTYATGGLAFVASFVFAITQPYWPEAKTALCRDGSYSASHHRPGTCSSHGGVERWRFAADDPFWRR